MKETGFDSEDGFYNIGQMIIGITAMLLDDPKGFANTPLEARNKLEFNYIEKNCMSYC